MENILRDFIVTIWSYIYSNIDKLDWKISLTEVIIYLVFSFGFVYLFKSFIISALRQWLEKTDWSIAKYLMLNNFFSRVVQLIPMIFLFNLMNNIQNETVSIISIKILNSIFVFLMGSLMFSILNSFEMVVENHKRMKELTFKPVFQLSKLIIIAVCFIFLYSVLADKSPTTVLTMLGAVSAVLLLVFQETIRNFVAYIQITTLKLFKKGDWIVVSDYGADGEVISIELNLVKVKNWDKTIVTIPTSACTNKSLINYNNMSKEGRRIMRCINIDMNTIKSLTNENIDKMKKINVLSDYINEKINENENINKVLKKDELFTVNGRTLTNIGTFRKYLEYYLKTHGEINQNHTLIVRQKPSSSEGLPIEIYCFVKNTEWVHYESVQSDIFDHIFKILPYFELSIFQKPTGKDFSNLNKVNN